MSFSKTDPDYADGASIISGTTFVESEAAASAETLPLLVDEIVYLDFLSDNPLKSTVMNRATGDVLFDITTPKMFTMHRVTTMRDAQGQIVGEYEQRSFKHDTVTFRGEKKKVNEWLPRRTWRSK